MISNMGLHLTNQRPLPHLNPTSYLSNKPEKYRHAYRPRSTVPPSQPIRAAPTPILSEGKVATTPTTRARYQARVDG